MDEAQRFVAALRGFHRALRPGGLTRELLAGLKADIAQFGERGAPFSTEVARALMLFVDRAALQLDSSNRSAHVALYGALLEVESAYAWEPEKLAGLAADLESSARI